MKLIEVTDKVVLTTHHGEWCQLPYPGHPKGCPNYNDKDHCPPRAPHIFDFMRKDKSHYFLVYKFDILAQEKRMKEKHPKWSTKMARNSRYWQGAIKSKLKKECETYNESVYTLLPEAMGVQVFLTAKNIGILIDRKPMDTIYKIAMLGYPKEISGLGEYW